MQFMIEISADQVTEGGKLEKVNVLQLDTGSFCPRSNRRKIRAFLVRYCGIAPSKVKQAMKQLDWQTPPRRTRSVLKAWVIKQGDVESRDVNRATMMIKHHPGSMLGIVDGFERRRVQSEYDEMREAEKLAAMQRESDLIEDMQIQDAIDKKHSWELQDVDTAGLRSEKSDS